MPRKRPSTRPSWRRLRLARLLRFVSALVVMLLSFQTVGVELVASHGDDASHPTSDARAEGGCADHDDTRGCDCGPNCHCCFACAHHVTPAIAGAAPAAQLARVATDALEAKTPIVAHVSSTDAAPPPKVPKLLA